MDCHFVTRNLCIGVNPQDQSDLKQLQSMGITAILSLQSKEDIRDRGADWEKSAAETEGLTYRNVSVTDYDSLDLKWKLPSCVKALRELLCAGHRVYLHCTAGISRSPTVAVAYLHWYENGRCTRPLSTRTKPDRDAVRWQMSFDAPRARRNWILRKLLFLRPNQSAAENRICHTGGVHRWLHIMGSDDVRAFQDKRSLGCECAEKAIPGWNLLLIAHGTA